MDAMLRRIPSHATTLPQIVARKKEEHVSALGWNQESTNLEDAQYPSVFFFFFAGKSGRGLPDQVLVFPMGKYAWTRHVSIGFFAPKKKHASCRWAKHGLAFMSSGQHMPCHSDLDGEQIQVPMSTH